MAALRDGLPFVIEGNDQDLIEGNDAKFTCRKLERSPFTESSCEEWLQRVLARCPALLPIAGIDERVEPPLLSLGIEVQTPAGAIDNLFISRNGYLVVVETKLWRNPEARRQVVAQVIDYGAQLRRWRYPDVEKLLPQTPGEKRRSLWDVVGRQDLDERDWIDKVNENLERGRMSLLVVGDGIRSEAEVLADAVAGHSDFQFRLALVEMRVFSLGEGRRVVVPATLAKTQEIERAVVRVEYQGERPTLTVETPPAKPGDRPVLTWDVLRDELRRQPQGEVAAKVAERLLDLLGDRFHIWWGASVFSVKTPDPGGSGKLLSLCSVANTGKLWAWLPSLEGQLEDLWQNAAAVKSVSEALRALLKKYGAKITASGNQYNLELPRLAGKEADLVADLERFTSLIKETAPREHSPNP